MTKFFYNFLPMSGIDTNALSFGCWPINDQTTKHHQATGEDSNQILLITGHQL